jgi:hypothetical protein
MTIFAKAWSSDWLRRVPAIAVIVLVGATVVWHLRGEGVAVAPVVPQAGTPVVQLADVGGPIPVVVVPNRPGWNLVHIAATEGVLVGPDRERLTAAASRPGASGIWAQVRLPAGPTRLWVARDEHITALQLDTGLPGPAFNGSPGVAAADFTGPDGPECVSAVLGQLAAENNAPVTSCPADTLNASDAAALHGTIRFLAQRGYREISLVADGSPRSMAAADVVRADSAAARVTIGSQGPLVVVAGWEAADHTLTTLATDRQRGADGAYLAPWLLYAPLHETPIAQLVPLSYSPRDPLPQTYVTALQSKFPGEPASASGYLAWRQTHTMKQDGPLRLYAVARISVPGTASGHSHGGGWLPQGTITAVTNALDGTPIST